MQEPDLCRTVPDRPDGKITLPMAEDIQAAGKATQVLHKTLHDQFASFIAVHEVTVIVQEVRTRKFNVVGQVVKQGHTCLRNRPPF